MHNANSQHAFQDMENYFFQNVSFTHIDYGNIVAYASGVYAPNLNPALVKKIDSSFSTSLTECKAFYLDKNIPWALVLPEPLYDDAIEQFLVQQQLKFTGKGVAMAVQIKDLQFPLNNQELTIQEIKGDLDVWLIPLMDAFGDTPETPGLYALRHQKAAQKNANLYHFSGFVGDVIVSSLTLSLHDNHARIDDVSTILAHEKKGYATTLMYAALKHAQTLNIETCFLEASEKGLSLYKRIGFQELFINRYYEVVE